MTSILWLASYPKSGNTWLRILLATLRTGDTIDINKLADDAGVASSRAVFDYVTLLASSLLTAEQVDELRPLVYQQLDQSPSRIFQSREGRLVVKVHDAYAYTLRGEPVLGGGRVATGAIVLVRDPRDIAVSLASHFDRSVDWAIGFMEDRSAALGGRGIGQLRQRVSDWSGHSASWLDQRDIPVHLIRYEDLHRDTATTLARAMRFAGWPISLDEATRAARLASFPSLQAQEKVKGFVERVSETTLFFREGRVGQWREVLTREQLERLERHHAIEMARLGYELSTRRPPEVAGIASAPNAVLFM